MIRKMLTIAAASVIPMTGFVGAVAVGAGTAGAGAPLVAAATCAISGAVTFDGGISANGRIDSSKTSTSTTSLSGTGTHCQPTVLTQNITQKSAKCADVTLVPAYVLGSLLTPAATILPGCGPDAKGKPSKLYETGTAWGFVGGVDVKGVPASTTDGIKLALTQGVPYSDNGEALTLLVGSVTADLPGGLCGTEAGFTLAGTVKKSATATWDLNLCLLGDTGPGTTGVFLTDIATAAIHTVTGTWSDGLSISTALVDPTTATLHIIP